MSETATETKPEEKKADDVKPADAPAPIVTEHQIIVDGAPLRYRVTTGMLPIKNGQTGETEANVFFMAYTVTEGAKHTGARRPLMFSFNGGPGSASVWLHLGALGPKRIAMEGEKGDMPAPPYHVEDNPNTWLPYTDLVFIDPVGTGYSRPTKPDLGKKFWSVQGDIDSIGEFIRLYLSRYERWSSPLFLVGESYGTTRSAGIAGYLIDRGIAFNGIVLVSSVMQFQTLEFDRGNDLPYTVFLPTYTATAFYHKKLAPELSTDLASTLKEAEAFADGEYAGALQKGDRLSGDERKSALSKLSRLTGLSETYLDDCDLRPEIFHFCKELLRREKKTVGRLDSRLTGRDEKNVSETPDYDPSMSAILPPYTSAFNDYVRTSLGYKTDDVYHILGTGITSPWDWQSQNKYVETASGLRDALVKNPHLKVFVASGYYDLATPYFATEYTISHMSLPSDLRPNITTRYYEAGHMMYIHSPSLAKLKDDVANFLNSK